jgi:aminoglycoside phosphotransferase (APT) family kinase protein
MRRRVAAREIRVCEVEPEVSNAPGRRFKAARHGRRVAAQPLTPANAAEFLKGQGLLPADAEVRARPLGGGVSAAVVLAESAQGRFVLKQPHTTFRVADEWHVDDRRAFVEFAFARAMPAFLPPGSLARVRAFVPESRVLVFDAAPGAFAAWKERLLVGQADPGLGARAGELLASIHRAGERPELDGRFRHPDLFEEQRLGPYFRTSASRLPEAAPALATLVRRFGERADLVHGDFSPKNLLTDGSRLMLIDHEVATRGDAAFDVAFLLSHLVLKGLHRPQDAGSFHRVAERFLQSYEARRPEDADAEARAVSYLGGLLIARALGKSPVEYLDAAGRSTSVQLGRRLLGEGPGSWSEAAAYLGTAV